MRHHALSTAAMVCVAFALGACGESTEVSCRDNFCSVTIGHGSDSSLEQALADAAAETAKDHRGATIQVTARDDDRDIFRLTCGAQTFTNPAKPGESIEELGPERSCLRTDLR